MVIPQSTVQSPKRYRTIFLSDIHLGSRSAKAAFLLDFLRQNEAETIYLVGDIVDGWRLKRSWFWPQEHNDVVQKLLRRSRKGTRIVYIAGNHDAFLRDFQGTHFGGIEVTDRAMFEAANGRKYLVLHGDQFDVVVRHARFIALMGDWAYDAALGFNLVMNAIRRKLGLRYWSFSAWAKYRVKKAVNFIGDFQNVVADEARRMGVDGVICGHIHHATIETIHEISYINTGDWVESCTAIVEHEDGRLELIDWTNSADQTADRGNVVALASRG